MSPRRSMPDNRDNAVTIGGPSMKRSPRYEWTAVRCRVPSGIGQVDTFLTRLVGPLMNALVDCGEVDDWFFDRPQPDAVGVYSSGGDSALLCARLHGLVSAIDVFGTTTPRPGSVSGGCRAPEVVGSVPGMSGTDARSSSTQLALDVIASTPTRVARLRTAASIALVATTATMARSADPHSAPDTLPDIRSGGTIDAADQQPLVSAPRGNLARLGTGRHLDAATLARRVELEHWVTHLLHAPVVGADPAPSMSPSCTVCRLHNQLGIGPGDDRLIRSSVVWAINRSRADNLPGRRRRSHGQPSVVRPDVFDRLPTPSVRRSISCSALRRRNASGRYHDFGESD